MLAGTRHRPNRRARCNAVSAHHLHAMRRQRRRVATAPISAMRRIHGTWSFATLLPEGPGAAVRSQHRLPLALRGPSSRQAALPESEGWLSGSVPPPRVPLPDLICRRSGRASTLHVLNQDAGREQGCSSCQARHARDGGVESARRENFRPALLAIAERPMVFAWGSLAFGCGTRKPPQICAWQKPRPSPLLLEPPTRHASVSRLFTSGRNPWVLPPHRVRKAVVGTQQHPVWITGDGGW